MLVLIRGIFLPFFSGGITTSSTDFTILPSYKLATASVILFPKNPPVL